MSKNKFLPAVLAAALLLLSSCAKSAPAETSSEAALITPEQTNYESVTVKTTDYIKTVKGGAAVYYPVECELDWEKSNSRIVEVYVSKGDAVKEGDVLATFSTEISEAELTSLRLQLQRAEEAFEEGKAERLKEIQHAQRVLDYNYTLDKKIATLELENLQIDYDMYVYKQETSMNNIREQIYEMELLVNENTIVAPYDGVIDWVISHNPGDFVDAGKTIFRMHSTENFVVAVTDAKGKLRYNQEVTIEAGRKNQRVTYTGRVITAPNVLPSDVNAALIVPAEGVTAEDLQYSPSYIANSEEMLGVILVERTALTADNGKYYVNILEDDIVKKRYVTVGSNNLQQYWILDGLEEGQSLVLN